MPEEPPLVHPELVAILDARAGRTHSATGSVVSALAEILDRHLELLAAAGRLLPGRAALADRAMIETITERDDAEEWADRLARAISLATGVDIGEHSNLNDPWQRALEAIEASRG